MKKDKLKLKPTLKEKRHYLVIELLSDERLSEGQAKQVVDDSILEFIGKLGYASAGPLYFGFHDVTENKSFKTKPGEEKENKMYVYNNDISKSSFKYRYLIMVSVLTKYVDYVKTSLTLFVGSDNNKKVKMKCIGVSGTILKAKRFLK